MFSHFPEYLLLLFACARFNIPWGVTKFQSWLKVMRRESYASYTFYCFVFFAADSSCSQLSMALFEDVAQNNWKQIANKFKLCILTHSIYTYFEKFKRAQSIHMYIIIMLAKYSNVCIAFSIFMFSIFLFVIFDGQTKIIQ